MKLFKSSRKVDFDNENIANRLDPNNPFQSLFENAAEGIIIADEKGQLININKAGSDIIGFTSPDLKSMNLWEFLYHDNQSLITNGIKMLEKDGLIKRRCKIKNKLGDQIIVEVSVSKYMAGRIHAIIRDVTEQAKNERQLVELAKFTEENPNPVMRVDNNGILLFSNKPANALLEDLNWNLNEVLPLPWLNRIQTVLQTNQKAEFEVKIKNYIFQFVLAPITEIGFVNIYGIDISDLVATRERAMESDRLKSTFLATISHELRTPLNAVIGFAELINDDTDMGEVIEFTEMIRESGKNLLSIVEDVLSLSQIDDLGVKLRTQTFRLSDLFIETKSVFDILLQHTQKDYLKIMYRPQLDLINQYIRGDKFRIRQVLIHLFKNALKFTEKGYIEVGFFSEDKKDLVFYIKDSGIGIAIDKQNYIFDYFRQVDDIYTRVHGGIGIGLSIANTITKAMGGSIRLESKEGEGSIFSLVLADTFEDIEKT